MSLHCHALDAANRSLRRRALALESHWPGQPYPAFACDALRGLGSPMAYSTRVEILYSEVMALVPLVIVQRYEPAPRLSTSPDVIAVEAAAEYSRVAIAVLPTTPLWSL